MEDLIFTYRLNSELIMKLKSGISISNQLDQVLTSYIHDFPRQVKYIKNNLEATVGAESSEYLQHLKNLIGKSIIGYPVHKSLEELEDLVFNEIENQMSLKIENIAFELLIPLLLFILPAFLILLLCPILSLIGESI